MRCSRQTNLPASASLSAISRATKIDRARPAALHLEQIETRLMLALGHQHSQTGRGGFETVALGAK